MTKPNKSGNCTNVFSRKQGNILGVEITGSSRKGLLTKISKYLKKYRHNKAKLASKRPLFITTPNPEQTVLAYKDPKFREILQKSDISLCDGVGLLAAYEYYLRLGSESNSKRRNKLQDIQFQRSNNNLAIEQFNNGPRRQNSMINIIQYFKSLYLVLVHKRSSDGIKMIKGRDFFLDLLSIANDRRYKVFLLGSTKKTLLRAVNKLSNKYPAVRFKSYRGAKLDSKSVPLTDKETRADKKSLRLINRFIPKMLFVAYGAPKQEKWAYRNIDHLKTDLVMMVGGSFDYIAGTRRNVPVLLNKLGLEWLWRLITGSQNIKRIYNAIIKFPYLVLKES
jgi:exopolysaccharide biosynthesis WecB/TagA/CpsF family protein